MPWAKNLMWCSNYSNPLFLLKAEILLLWSIHISYCSKVFNGKKNWFYNLGHVRVNKRVHFIMTIIKLFSKITFFTTYLLKFKPQNKPDYCFCLVPRYINLGRKNSIKVTLFFAWNSYQSLGSLFGLKIPKESMKKILKIFETKDILTILCWISSGIELKWIHKHIYSST